MKIKEWHSPQNQMAKVGRHLCNCEMKPGKAIEQVYTGSPDFPGCEVVTMSANGQGRLIDCLKCEKCGWSVTG